MAITTEPSSFTITFEELNGSPRETLTGIYEAGTAVEREFKCAWSDRIQLAREFVGYITRLGVNTVIHKPHVYETISGYIVAKRALIKSFGKISAHADDSQLSNYEHAHLTIEYGFPSPIRATQSAFRDKTDSTVYKGELVITETLQAVSEFLTLPITNLYWDTGANKEPIADLDAPGKIMVMTEWTYHIQGAGYIPPGLMLFPGKVNMHAVTSISLGVTFPAGTLLCGNPTVSKETTFDETTYDILLRFVYKAGGWNYFPRVGESGSDISWERLTDGTNAKNIYEEANFGPYIV